MPIRLTEQQQRALDSTEAQPPQVVDPRTNAAYVLIPLTEYEAVREIVEDERRQRDIRVVALRNAGRRKAVASGPEGVVAESWGILRLPARQVRELLAEEDGLLEAGQLRALLFQPTDLE